jgi:biopolymer transport protein ExbB
VSLVFDYYEHFIRFLYRGGPVIIAICCTSVLMWALIVERYWFLFRMLPAKEEQARQEWTGRSDRSSWYAKRIREQLVGEINQAMRQNLPLIKALVTVLPFLGLLGTVNGMIHSFEVLRVFGTDNARGLTAGIAEALFTTLTGLLTALSGLYFSVHLHRRADREQDRLLDQLELDNPAVGTMMPGQPQGGR